MNTRKIRGGLLGSETKKQIKCIEKFIKNVYIYCNAKEQKIIHDLEINTKNNRHFISKLFRTPKSNYEIERDNLLEFLKIKIFNKISNHKYNYLIPLIDDIIKNNNKGDYYKTYNTDNGTKYKRNYELFNKTFCDNLDEVSEDFKQKNKLCTIEEDDESYSFMDAPLTVSNNTLRSNTLRTNNTLRSINSYSRAQGRRKRKGKGKTNKRNKKI